MTDRVDGLLVVLARDMRDDDVEAIADAIRQLRGVIDVRSHIADIPSNAIAVRRAKVRLLNAISEVFYNDPVE